MTDIEEFLKDFGNQLNTTCRIHKCPVSGLDSALWDITLNAALEMGRIRRVRGNRRKETMEFASASDSPDNGGDA